MIRPIIAKYISAVSHPSFKLHLKNDPLYRKIANEIVRTNDTIKSILSSLTNLATIRKVVNDNKILANIQKEEIKINAIRSVLHQLNYQDISLETEKDNDLDRPEYREGLCGGSAFEKCEMIKDLFTAYLSRVNP
jgi:hypothetical protein